MPSDEYASASRGALRLKGAKVEKHKKKHKKSKDKKDKKDKDKDRIRADRAGELSLAEASDKEKEAALDDAALADIDPYARMTPAERRFLEAQDKKIRLLLHATPEEAKAALPELFKSHKERLADLNTYLSRLSEHNDMPKIGPG